MNWMKNAEKFLQESAEFQSRLTEGFKVAGKLGEIRVGTTPKDEIHQQNELRLYRYRPLTNIQKVAEPLLIVYALVNRPYIVDLHEQRSLVRGLLNQGIDGLSYRLGISRTR